LSLVHFGYAATDGKQFWLAPRVLRLGQSYLGGARLPRLVQPFIQRVSMASGETINASVLDGHEVVYVARSSAPRWVSIGYQVGVRVPAHAVTPGVVILAARPPEDIKAWIAAHDFASFTAHTVTDQARFHADVRSAHEQGYWATGQQLDPALRGMSVALLDRKGACRGAIGCTTPAANYTQQQLIDKLLPLLREAAQALQPLL
jgi:IclR family transcriptional regulator, pca regulon regulatory protein